MSAEAIDRVLTWIDLNAPYYPEYAGGAFRDHPFGRSPLNQAQLRVWEKLTGSNLLRSPRVRKAELHAARIEPLSRAAELQRRVLS